MDFAWGAREEELRADLRAFFEKHLTDQLEDRLYTSGVSHDEDFARGMGERNWIAPDWARDGFDALDVFAVHVIMDELTRADAPMVLIATSA